MDDVIKLISVGTPAYDSCGNEYLPETVRQIFCKVRSVGRTEFYQAAQNNLHPEYVFTISNYRDYMGEKELLYTDWTGEEKRYAVERTFRDGDSVELTVTERVGLTASVNDESE